MPSKVRKVIETLFQIYDKNGDLVDFKLNAIQRRFDEEVIVPIEHAEENGYDVPPVVLDRLRSSVLKYRQGGISILILAWFLTKCMQRYCVCVMLTHDKEASEKLLYRARIMLKNLKGAQPETSKLNDNEIAFAKTNSLFYIGTAGSKEFGRSATINYLHCSEIAFWKDPARLMKSLFQAVPKLSGVIIQETTANGWGNWFQKSYYSYMGGRGGFIPQFFPWYIHEDYVSTTPYVPNAIEPVERREERKLYRRIRKALPDLPKSEVRAKLQWRREKIDENIGDQTRQSAIRDFNQEYPSTIEEAFIMTGGSLFGDVRRVESPDWQIDSAYSYIKTGHPKAGYTYALGADYAGGTGNDSSTIIVLCLETREQVYRWSDNYINPVDFSALIVEQGKRFNEAYLVPEVNNHGIAGVNLVKKAYPLHRIYKHVLVRGFSNAQHNVQSYGYGWRTTATSKPYMVGIAQQFLLNGWVIYDSLTEDELRSFAEDPETGKLAGTGAHDDHAISFMLACLGILRLLRNAGIDLDNLNDNVIEVAAEAIQSSHSPTRELTVGNPAFDANGRYLLTFEDMFTVKGRRTIHAV